MALEQLSELIFGARALTVKDLLTSNSTSYEVLDGSVNCDFTVEFADLIAGNAKMPIAREVVSMAGTIEATLKQVNSDWMQTTIGATVVVTAASAVGSIINFTEFQTNLVVNPSNGIALVGLKAGAEKDLKAGIYVITVETATTISLKRNITGDGVKFDPNIPYQVTGTDITIVDSVASDFTDVDNLASFGIEFTGGSSVAMTPGDRFSFEIIAPHGAIDDIVIGELIQIPIVELQIYSEVKNDGGYTKITIPRAQASGLPITLNVGDFADTSSTFMMLECPSGDRALISIIKGTDEVDCT